MIITVIEVEEKPTEQKREWNHLGDLNLGQQADTINLRDFAHD